VSRKLMFSTLRGDTAQQRPPKQSKVFTTPVVKPTPSPGLKASAGGSFRTSISCQETRPRHQRAKDLILICDGCQSASPV